MHALRVLEFEAIRDRLQRHSETSLGEAAARATEPSFEASEVWRLLGETREAMDFIARHSMPSLGAVRDLRESVNRAAKGGGLAGAEAYLVGETLRAMRVAKAAIQPRRSDYPALWTYVEDLPEHPRLEDVIFDSLESDGAVKDGASPALLTLRQRKRASAQRIQERIQSYTTGSKRDLLSDPIFTIRDGRYVIPLKAENRGKIRGIVHDTSSTGATVFLEPEDVLQLGNALREIEAAERQEEIRILAEISEKIGAIAGEASVGVEQVARLDLVLAKAKLGYDLHGAIPAPIQSVGIKIQGGRHPLLDPATAVPLDLEVYAEGDSVLITGPNTGGKTVAIKTVGLFVLMLQSGIPAPAIDLRLGPFGQVWADIGDEQSLEQSLSTFSGHVKNIAAALRGLRPGGLVLLDEVGAGTDPAEGAALARAVLLSMRERGAAILASTHYGELKALAFTQEGFQNASMEFDVKTLRPTYRLRMGAPGASQALRIAERCGIPRDVVERAVGQLDEQQQDVATMLERLDQAQKQARIAQGEADRRQADLRRKEEDVERRLREARQIRESAHAKAHEEIEAVLRDIRIEAADIFDELKRGPDRAGTEAARARLKGLQEVGRDLAPEPLPTKPSGEVEITKGMSVRIEGYPQVGTVIEAPKGGMAVVQVGALKMSTPVSKLEIVARSVKESAKPRSNMGLKKAQTASTELHLRMMRAEDAERELERFIDDAVLAGLDSVRIVHGKGEGILRKLTQDYLRRHPHVRAYRLADASEGGDGVTVATFK